MSARAATADPLLEWRARFPSLERTLHFASHTLGAMPAAAADDLADYARTWSERGIRAWEERWMGVPAEVAGSLETLLNAPRGSVSLHPNVTVAQAVALSCVDFTAARPRLVCTDEDFPSVLYLYEGLVRRGAEIVRVRAHEGRRIAEDEIVAAIDERTAVVAISTVLFRTAQALDLGPIVRRARGRRAHAARRLPGGGHAGNGPGRARPRPRHRRLGEVALRRARHRLAVRAARAGGLARAGADRLVRAR